MIPTLMTGDCVHNPRDLRMQPGALPDRNWPPACFELFMQNGKIRKQSRARWRNKLPDGALKADMAR